MAICAVQTVPSRTREAWALASAYVVAYAVAFLFLVGPANALLAQAAGGVTAVSQTQFLLVLTAALVMAAGAPAMSFWLGRVVDDAERRPTLVWQAWTVVFALAMTALYVVVAASVMGGSVREAAMAGALAVMVPAAVAGVTTPHTAASMVRRNRDMASGVITATIAVALVGYFAMTFLHEALDLVPVIAFTV